jgi:glycosyltransferase involved in cell wall biosynthesis
MLLPFVDVVIPHLNDHDRLEVCLDLLHRQTYPRDRYRMVVVDNGSDKPLDEIVAKFPLVSVVYERERGCGSARNCGVRLTQGDILAFTDSDCRPNPDWIVNGVRCLMDGQADIVGGEIKVFCADDQHPTAVELFDKTFGFEQRRYVRHKHFSAGANIFVPRRVFEAIGPFRNVTQPEDVEWGRRAHAMGLRLVFGPDVLIHHPARRTWAELQSKAYRTVWHSRNYMAEHKWFRLRWLFYACGVSLPPLLMTWKLLTSPELRGVHHRWLAVATLFRQRYYRAGLMFMYLFAPVSGGKGK